MSDNNNSDDAGDLLNPEPPSKKEILTNELWNAASNAKSDMCVDLLAEGADPNRPVSKITREEGRDIY